MMTALIIVGSLSSIGSLFVIAAGLAARRPMPAFERGVEPVEVEGRTLRGRSPRPTLLMPAVSH